MGFVGTIMTSGSNRDSFVEIADDVAAWCLGMEDQSRRRREESELDDKEARMEMWKDYRENVLERLSLVDDGLANAFRRKSAPPLGWTASDIDLPENIFGQCAGYAKALAVLLSEGRGDDAAALFGANANGDATEKHHGCGSVVNEVNAAIEDGSETFEIAEDENGNEVVIVPDDSALSSALAGFLNTVVLAGSSGIAMKLMDVCRDYQA